MNMNKLLHEDPIDYIENLKSEEVTTAKFLVAKKSGRLFVFTISHDKLLRRVLDVLEVDEYYAPIRNGLCLEYNDFF